MKKLLSVASLFVMLCAVGCMTDQERRLSQERQDAWLNFRVGNKMPNILKETLMEETNDITKWRINFRIYVTCKRDTIVAIWRTDN